VVFFNVEKKIITSIQSNSQRQVWTVLHPKKCVNVSSKLPKWGKIQNGLLLLMLIFFFFFFFFLRLTIVAVVHQPRFEIFSLFDDVLLLGKGGRTVFMGPTADALGYFEQLGFKCPQYVNPADVSCFICVAILRISQNLFFFFLF
jgi:hypothetical protein